IFDGTGEVICYNGNYAAFKAEQREAEQPPKVNSMKEAEKPAKPAEAKTKLTFREQREYELLDSEISSLERQITEQTNLLSTETDYQAIAAMAETIDQLTQQLDVKTERWLTLSEYV